MCRKRNAFDTRRCGTFRRSCAVTRDRVPRGWGWLGWAWPLPSSPPPAAGGRRRRRRRLDGRARRRQCAGRHPRRRLRRDDPARAACAEGLRFTPPAAIPVARGRSAVVDIGRITRLEVDPDVAYGDLDGDGNDEAVVHVVCTYGANGAEDTVHVWTQRRGRTVHVASLTRAAPVGHRSAAAGSSRTWRWTGRRSRPRGPGTPPTTPTAAPAG